MANVLNRLIVLFSALAFLVVNPTAQCQGPTAPIRVGIIGLDTSHAIAFAKLMNDSKAEGPLKRCRVVCAYPHGSADIESSVSRIPKYTEQIKAMDVEIVDSIDDLISKVDAVLLETNDGRPHLEQALPVLKAQKPIFIDKPIAASLVDTVAIFEAAKHFGTPVFSSSSLRFVDQALAARKGELVGKVLGCETFSPASLEPTHPDLYWYGIHGVEQLFTVMGTGCETVVRSSTDSTDVVVGVWDDGRVGTFRGTRSGKSGYGGTVFGEKGQQSTGGYAGYGGLVIEIGLFFESHKAPVTAAETIEIYAFMSAADKSKRNNGAPVSVASVLERAERDAAAKLSTLFSTSAPQKSKSIVDFGDRQSIIDRRPLIIAHRGGVVSPKSPECSLTAVRLAANQGYDMVELDIQISKDGVPMVFHDRTMAKACEKEGAVSDYNAAELETFEYSASDDRVARLDTVLELCRELKLGVMLDLKAGRDSAEFLEKLRGLLEKHQLVNSTITFSGSETSRRVLQGVRFTPTDDEVRRLRAGEKLDLSNRFWFGIPQRLMPGDIKKLKASGALIIPAINTFRYPAEQHPELAKADVEQLTRDEVDGFQIDSVYYSLFDSSPDVAAFAPQTPARWWKGNLHTHSLWSDGNDFPEMIADWYRQRGYNFLALSDHNILSEGQRWMKLSAIESRNGKQALPKYLSRFGRDWVETRGNKSDDTMEVRLKPLSEFRTLVESNGEFLMIQSEEITDKGAHINATNIAEVIEPQGGDSVRETIQNNLRAVDAQAKRLGRIIVPHLNHPNLGDKGISAEDLAAIVQDEFFEVFNGVDQDGDLGSDRRHSLETLWDITSTLRLSKLGTRPMFGLATDDSHEYHGKQRLSPGRGWIMLRAKHLSPESIVKAMKRGEFYASSGVELRSVEFDASSKTLRIEIEPNGNAEFTTQFIGTPKEFDETTVQRTDKDGKPVEGTLDYSQDVGKVFATKTGLSVTYQLTGEELYVRATITSNKSPENPTSESPLAKAWTQPVGWSIQ